MRVKSSYQSLGVFVPETAAAAPTATPAAAPAAPAGPSFISTITGAVTGGVASGITGAAGTEISKIIGGVTSGTASSRGDRLAAQENAVQAMQSAKAVKATTAQFAGYKLGKAEFESLRAQIYTSWNAIIAATAQYKAAAGLAGLGRTEAEKAAERSAGVAMAIANTQSILNASLADISTGRTAPRISGTQQVAVPTVGKLSLKKYLPFAAIGLGVLGIFLAVKRYVL